MKQTIEKSMKIMEQNIDLAKTQKELEKKVKDLEKEIERHKENEMQKLVEMFQNLEKKIDSIVSKEEKVRNL